MTNKRLKLEPLTKETITVIERLQLKLNRKEHTILSKSYQHDLQLFPEVVGMHCFLAVYVHEHILFGQRQPPTHST